MTLREELASIDEQINALEEKRREIYHRSITAPEAEKICENTLAHLIAEPDCGTLKYPVSVSGIHFEGTLVEDWRKKANQLVRIRPCGEEFGGKTYLGLYLGDVARTVGCTYDRESGVLGVYVGVHNPAIWVPSLKRVIFGCESWWGVIESEAQLREISNEAIDGIWYVQAMKSLLEGKEADAQG
jgi:hypothetical protein